MGGISIKNSFSCTFTIHLWPYNVNMVVMNWCSTKVGTGPAALCLSCIVCYFPLLMDSLLCIVLIPKSNHCKTPPSVDPLFQIRELLFTILFAFQRSGVRDRDTIMSAKVNMEAPPKEPDRTPLDPSPSSPSEAVLICGSDGVAKKARPQPHTTTTFLLPGEHSSEGGSVPTWV